MHHQGKGNGTEGDNAAEIFAEGRIAEDILTRLGRDNKKTVEKQDAKQGVGNTSPEDCGTSGQDGGAGEDIAVEMDGP